MKKLSVHLFAASASSSALVQLGGDLCGMEAMALKDRLLNYIAQTGFSLTIDLTEINQTDLTGINALAMIYRQTARAGANLQILAHRQESLDRWLRLTSFDRLLPIQYISA